MQIQISSADYLSAIRAGMKPRPAFAVLGGLIIVLVLVALIVLLYAWHAGERDWTDAIGLAAIAYFPAWYWLYLPWKVRRLYAQQRALQEPASVEISTGGLEFRTANGEGLLRWENVYRWRETGDVFVLYQSDVLLHPIPKRCFDSVEAQSDFRMQLLDRVGPVGEPRKRS